MAMDHEIQQIGNQAKAVRHRANATLNLKEGSFSDRGQRAREHQEALLAADIRELIDQAKNAGIL